MNLANTERDMQTVLTELADLLAPTRPDWSAAMRRLAERLNSGQESPSDIARDVLGLYTTGMGGFSDIVLQNRSGVLSQQTELGNLRTELFNQASKEV